MRYWIVLAIAAFVLAGCSEPEPSIHWQAGVPYCGNEVAGADENAAARGQYDVAVCPDKILETEKSPGSL